MEFFNEIFNSRYGYPGYVENQTSVCRSIRVKSELREQGFSDFYFMFPEKLWRFHDLIKLCRFCWIR